MTDQIQFTETNLGKFALKLATAKLTKRGVPLSSNVVASVKNFLTQVASPSPARWRARPLRRNPDWPRQIPPSTPAKLLQEDLKDSGRAGSSLSHPSSARILVAGMTGSATSSQFPSDSAGAATGSSSGRAAEEAHNAAKRQRLATRPATARPAHQQADTWRVIATASGGARARHRPGRGPALAGTPRQPAGGVNDPPLPALRPLPPGSGRAGHPTPPYTLPSRGARWEDRTRAKARDPVRGGLTTLPSSRVVPSPRGRARGAPKPPPCNPPRGDTQEAASGPGPGSGLGGG
jgi:hypothetical protein